MRRVRIQKLSENTIKVILTKEDFVRRNIDVKKLHPGSQTYRQLVLEVMAQASGEFNFDASDCRLVVEGSMSLKNELTLLISKSPTGNMPPTASSIPPDELLAKLPTPEEFSKLLEEALGSEIAASATEKLLREKQGHDEVLPTEIVICFNEFDKLISLLHTMPSAKAIASRLYVYNDAYYLALKVYERNMRLAIIFRNCASEFDGEQIDSETIIPILLEHGTLVIKKGAISTLLKNFD
ncbi:MAG: hypothetical protein E7384_02530 [Ruminococcaceae bacterium]|nr:hypothetical protein [Oscillospiraceae bacterium]